MLSAYVWISEFCSILYGASKAVKFCLKLHSQVENVDVQVKRASMCQMYMRWLNVDASVQVRRMFSRLVYVQNIDNVDAEVKCTLV